eukprot:CAMPEP_0202743610 /NCGR_PEP_ID=MMETSP1388-20130828/5942_1 /ASSEMBLY_ACC=CAM_ASM_000864 /TAXON_ID=37098 /ORGANISM="Isochrysis sp, Strain CCMP1244" /LENGTH=89 /DNA_ID=CAMNT_0049410645 /DNA_START=1 /DNA_END=266 /DNA_ORIENTATION=+
MILPHDVPATKQALRERADRLWPWDSLVTKHGEEHGVRLRPQQQAWGGAGMFQASSPLPSAASDQISFRVMRTLVPCSPEEPHNDFSTP